MLPLQKKQEHASSRCREKEVLFCFEDREFAGSELRKKGFGRRVESIQILLDTVCSRTMVNQKCFPLVEDIQQEFSIKQLLNCLTPRSSCGCWSGRRDSGYIRTG